MYLIDLKYGKIGILLSFHTVTILAHFSLFERFQRYDDSSKEYGSKFQNRPYAVQSRHAFFFQADPFEQLNQYEWCNKTTYRKKSDSKSNETIPKEPLNYTSFSANLIREDFAEFEKEMNMELKMVDEMKDNITSDWKNLDAFRIFMALSFCPMADSWDVSTDEDTPNGRMNHLMVPTDDNVAYKTGFILNYGLCATRAGMRKMAKRELARMVIKDLGSDLRDHVLSVRRMYRIFIAFHGPEGAVEYHGPSELRPPSYANTPSNGTTVAT